MYTRSLRRSTLLQDLAARISPPPQPHLSQAVKIVVWLVPHARHEYPRSVVEVADAVLAARGDGVVVAGVELVTEEAYGQQGEHHKQRQGCRPHETASALLRS